MEPKAPATQCVYCYTACVCHACLTLASLIELTLVWCAVLDTGLAAWLRDGAALLSLNRYERKKNIGLAIEALAEVVRCGARAGCRLVVAGGHDARLRENVEHDDELRALAARLDVGDRVVFLKDISDAQRCNPAARWPSLRQCA